MSEMICRIEELPEASGCRAILSGDLRITNAASLCQQVLSACEKYPQVELLLQEVTSCDLSALQILLSSQHDSATHVSLRLGRETQLVLQSAELAGMDSLFTAH